MRGICYIGGTRYSKPLDTTSEKKFRKLATLGELYVIGFSVGIWPRRFTQNSHFYLLPRLPFPVLRYAEMFVVGPVLAIWCIVRHNVGILVAQSPYEGFAASLAKIGARLLGRRVALVVESHGDFDISVFMQRDVLLSRLYRFMMRRTSRFALHHAEILRCISNATRSQLEALIPGKPIVQFPTWTDLDVFLEAGARRKQEGSKKIILYVGTLIPRKGVHLLLDAFGRIASEFEAVGLWLIGKAEDGEYAQALRDQATRMRLSERVHFLGPMPQEKLAEHMTEAEVLVLPSLSEGLGRVVFEAMACGTPVIGSHVDGIPEMITEGENGFLVPPSDVSLLAERLRWILRHPREAYVMGQRGREFAGKFFSQETYVQNYASLFELASQVVETHA